MWYVVFSEKQQTSRYQRGILTCFMQYYSIGIATIAFQRGPGWDGTHTHKLNSGRLKNNLGKTIGKLPFVAQQ